MQSIREVSELPDVPTAATAATEGMQSILEVSELPPHTISKEQKSPRILHARAVSFIY